VAAAPASAPTSAGGGATRVHQPDGGLHVLTSSGCARRPRRPSRRIASRTRLSFHHDSPPRVRSGSLDPGRATRPVLRFIFSGPKAPHTSGRGVTDPRRSIPLRVDVAVRTAGTELHRRRSTRHHREPIGLLLVNMFRRRIQNREYSCGFAGQWVVSSRVWWSSANAGRLWAGQPRLPVLPAAGMTPPRPARSMASARSWVTMSLCWAPSALRMPISRVHSVTATNTMFIIPSRALHRSPPDTTPSPNPDSPAVGAFAARARVGGAKPTGSPPPTLPSCGVPPECAGRTCIHFTPLRPPVRRCANVEMAVPNRVHPCTHGATKERRTPAGGTTGTMIKRGAL
jgi:hypothetical protein